MMNHTHTLELLIDNQMMLDAAYMPFIKNGGIFIPTDEKLQIGDHVFVEISLPTQTERLKFEGIVIWITPNNAIDNIVPGLGVQFTGKNAENIHQLIKNSLYNELDVSSLTLGGM